jgi:DNA processing protein
MDERVYWIAFNLIKGIGAVRFQSLLDHFGDAESAWNASSEELSRAGLGEKILERFRDLKSTLDLEKYWNSIQTQGIRVLTWMDAEYPPHLKEIEQPPPVLYVRGEITSEDHWAVAVVGTRQVTAYGRQVTEELTSALVQNGVTVISGLARGVDAIAHSVALKQGGRTLAVLGSGVDKIYPPEHRQMAEKILMLGALVSDYAPGTPPESTNFPPRNRIISGLSMAVVVVEAGETSGALITADFAAEQGREVFAVPGNIMAPQSKGCNRLIANGARPLLKPEDVLEALDLTRNIERREVRRAAPSDATEAALLELLDQEPLHVDDIRAQSGLPIEKITSTLTMMELKGMVRQVGKMNFVSVREDRANYEVEKG